MKILAFDTSAKFLSVAVLDEEKCLSSFHKDIGTSHSSMLIPTIGDVLKETHLKLKDIDVIGLGIGPGSFTGLRIGVSTAKGLSLTTGIPVIGIPSLDIIAYNYIKEIGFIAPILDAKKNKVYSAVYESDFGEIRRVSDYLLLNVDELLEKLSKPTIFFGDGLMLYGKYMQEKNPFVKIAKDQDWHPRAEVVGKLALEKAKKKEFDDIDALVPMYLHPKECNIRGYN